MKAIFRAKSEAEGLRLRGCVLGVGEDALRVQLGEFLKALGRSRRLRRDRWRRDRRRRGSL